MNEYINNQIINMISMAKSFKNICVMDARKDDGQIDIEEQKQLENITKATNRFIDDLQKIH